MATRAPSLTKRLTMPRPMPELPPVTMTTLSLNLISLPFDSSLQLVFEPERRVAEEPFRRLQQAGHVDAAMDDALPEHPVMGGAGGLQPCHELAAVIEERIELGPGHQ